MRSAQEKVPVNNIAWLVVDLPAPAGVLQPVIQIGGVTATVQFAGLVSPGERQFNVVIPATLGDGDPLITATYGGVSTPSAASITVHS
jgi:uncharacterized protein (TIGR03437 family)